MLEKTEFFKLIIGIKTCNLAGGFTVEYSQQYGHYAFHGGGVAIAMKRKSPVRFADRSDIKDP
jgi:hypothetical protein